jgi:hypothetical protein
MGQNTDNGKQHNLINNPYEPYSLEGTASGDYRDNSDWPERNEYNSERGWNCNT